MAGEVREANKRNTVSSLFQMVFWHLSNKLYCIHKDAWFLLGTALSIFQSNGGLNLGLAGCSVLINKIIIPHTHSTPN